MTWHLQIRSLTGHVPSVLQIKIKYIYYFNMEHIGTNKVKLQIKIQFPFLVCPMRAALTFQLLRSKWMQHIIVKNFISCKLTVLTLILAFWSCDSHAKNRTGRKISILSPSCNCCQPQSNSVFSCLLSF